MKFSLVIPLYNESLNVERIKMEVPSALDKIAQIEEYEIICIDDCSTDDTLVKLKAIKNPVFNVYKLEKKGGQSAAIAAGIRKCSYEIIGLIDADLQTSPHDFEKLIFTLLEGYDCVTGCRKKRNDNLNKRISTTIARNIRQWFLKDSFYDITAPLKVFKKECMAGFTFYDTFHRFIPLLIQMQGYKVVEIDIDHFPRTAGESKYGIRNRLWPGITSMFAIKWMLKSYLAIDVEKGDRKWNNG